MYLTNMFNRLFNRSNATKYQVIQAAREEAEEIVEQAKIKASEILHNAEQQAITKQQEANKMIITATQTLSEEQQKIKEQYAAEDLERKAYSQEIEQQATQIQQERMKNLQQLQQINEQVEYLTAQKNQLLGEFQDKFDGYGTIAVYVREQKFIFFTKFLEYFHATPLYHMLLNDAFNNCNSIQFNQESPYLFQFIHGFVMDNCLLGINQLNMHDLNKLLERGEYFFATPHGMNDAPFTCFKSEINMQIVKIEFQNRNLNYIDEMYTLSLSSEINRRSHRFKCNAKREEDMMYLFTNLQNLSSSEITKAVLQQDQMTFKPQITS